MPRERIGTSPYDRKNGAEKTGWDGEKEARLKLLWGRGLSAREISKKMGVSQGAVMGKARQFRDNAQTPEERSFWTRLNTPTTTRLAPTIKKFSCEE